MIACNSCGVLSPEEAARCQRCGTPLVDEVVIRGNSDPDTLVDVAPLDLQNPHTKKLSHNALPPWPLPEVGNKVDSARLVVIKGRALVADYVFHSPIISIGRDSDVDIAINSTSISREHCRIRRDQEGYVLQDLGTSNGTTVNGRAAVLQRLIDGDEIGLGEFLLIYQPTAEQLGKLEYWVNSEADGGGDGKETTYLTQEQIELVRRTVVEERHAHLKLIGGRIGKRFPLLHSTSVLGRSIDADVPLRGWFVGQRHAVVERGPEGFKIKHVAGVRRVFVNGKPAREAALKNRDQIRIGKLTFQFYDAVSITS